MKPLGIYSKVNRVAPAIVAEAKSCAVSDLHESMDIVRGRRGLMSMHMRPLQLGQHIAGPAITAWCPPGDNLMMHCALFYAQPGDVLIIHGGIDNAGSQWGDLAGTFAQQRGLAGVVVAGGVRDVQNLVEMKFPVWSTAVTPARSDKRLVGMVNCPMTCDGADVAPGDLVVADSDGVVVVPKAYAAEVLDTVRARREKERRVVEGIQAGRTLFELAGLGKNPADAKLPIFDSAWDD